MMLTGCTPPLIDAARSNDIKKMETLLHKGADVNKEWVVGSTALWWAVRNNVSLETVRFLLDKGADVNKGMTNGWTPLLVAVYNGNAKMVKLLLDYGADITGREPMGHRTPVQLAEEKGYSAIARMLRDHEQQRYEKLYATTRNQSAVSPSPNRRINTPASSQKAWLGISIQDITPELAKAFDMENTSGAIIVDLMKQSPAEQSGLRKGDIILEANRTKINKAAEFPPIVSFLAPGDNLLLLIKRDTKQFYAVVKPDPIPQAMAKITGTAPALPPGLSLKSNSGRDVLTSDIDELPRVQIPPRKNAYAIVIGIEKYRQKLPRADFAEADAKSVGKYLTSVMGYPKENIVTLVNDYASYVDLAKYFEKWLPNNVESDSTVFVYYSGHGAPNPRTGDAYLVPYDGDPSFIDQTGYSLKRMYDALGKLPAKKIIVALDSCFSGAGGRSVIAKGARPLVMNIQSTMVLPGNITVLSASSGDQISSTYDQKGHGLFTYFLLKGIKNEDVVNPDGSLRLDDLFGYLKPQVERIARKQYNNEQTPQLIVSENL